MSTLKDILALATKLKSLITETTKVSESLKNKKHYFSDDTDIELLQKSDLDTVLSNLKQLSTSIDLKDKEYISKDEIETIVMSYNEIIVNLKEWKKIKYSIKLSKEEKEDFYKSEDVLLTVIEILRNKIEKAEEKTKNMRLKLAIKKLINYIDEECKILKVREST